MHTSLEMQTNDYSDQILLLQCRHWEMPSSKVWDPEEWTANKAAEREREEAAAAAAAAKAAAEAAALLKAEQDAAIKQEPQEGVKKEEPSGPSVVPPIPNAVPGNLPEASVSGVSQPGSTSVPSLGFLAPVSTATTTVSSMPVTQSADRPAIDPRPLCLAATIPATIKLEESGVASATGSTAAGGAPAAAPAVKSETAGAVKERQHKTVPWRERLKQCMLLERERLAFGKSGKI